MSWSQPLERSAARRALEFRRRVGVTSSEPICAFEFAERLGLEVMFCDVDSLEGMYVKGSESILLPASRPIGRQAFTCAHELGHWAFGHGTRVDPKDLWGFESSDDSEERIANVFASYLLMPPRSVELAFARRGLKIDAATPKQLYGVACQLGVGYESLVTHLRWSMRVISSAAHDEFLKSGPKQVRDGVIGRGATGRLVIADYHWTAVAIDIQVGDLVLLPAGTIVEGENVRPLMEVADGQVLTGVAPGLARAAQKDGPWSAFIRVSRKDYVGRSMYRHLEDPDNNV